MIYSFAAYRQGSTNGQRPFAHVVITDVESKEQAQAIALKHLRCYKVLGFRHNKRADAAEIAARKVELYKHDCPILSAKEA